MKPICVLPPIDADRPRCQPVTAELLALEGAAGGPSPPCTKTCYCGRAPRTPGSEGLWVFC